MRESQRMYHKQKQDDSSVAPLSAPSFSVTLYNAMLFPLPSCSISTSVTALTFPLFGLSLSSSLLSSLHPFQSCPICPPSRSACSKNSITIKMFVWGQSARGGWRHWYYQAVTPSDCSDSPGGPTFNRKPFTHLSVR